jgi:hypothetical protein
MERPWRPYAWLVGLCLLAGSPAQATDLDLLALQVEGVRLGMNTAEAGAALDNRGYTQTRKTSFERKDRDGMHYVGLKLNPGGEVISVEVAHFLNDKIDPDAHRDRWIAEWGEPDRRMGNAGHDWNLTYENDAAIMDSWAKSFPRPELRMRLVSKGQVLAARRGHEVPNKICMAIKDKPVSLLNVNDRNHLMECLRTGQLRIVAP